MIEKRSIEELLERANFLEVAQNLLPDLGGTGANRTAQCPWCNAPKKERKFSIAVAKAVFKCFACGEGGHGALNLLMKVKRIPYIQGVQWLADFYKMELREAEASVDAGGMDTAYFDQRMGELGYKPREGKGLFRAHSSGGIEIRFPKLKFAQGESPWQQHDGKDFIRLRRHPSKVTSTQKYEQEAGSGIRIFVPTEVVELYRAGQQFPTLFVVEGEFKAYVMAKAGVPIVAMTGINMYHREKGSKELHPDLMELIRVGRCASVVVVHDADCMVVKWDAIAEPKKDLGKRLKDFASAVTGFRLAIGALVQRVYFTRIHRDYADKAKGLDDLAALRGPEDVAQQLHQLKSTDLFRCVDITDSTWRSINGLFNLNQHGGVPKAFYDQWQSLIGDRSFHFCGGTYRYELNEDGDGKLMMEEHPHSKRYLRIGCDHFRRIQSVDPYGVPFWKLKAWKDAVINRDYVNKGFKNFYDTIEKFDDDILEPGHHEDYKAVVDMEEGGRLYNKYKPLTRQPKKGKLDTTIQYLKDIFGEHPLESIDQAGKVVATSPAWVVYMDYLTIMYRFPRKRLPGVALVSPEKKTGKSKLLEYNCALWEANAVMVGNDVIGDMYNDDWVHAQFVGVDETLLDKKHEQERMKRRITGNTEQTRAMYQGRNSTLLIAKFHFTSNNADNFITLDDDEMRYWVIAVKPPKLRDHKLLEKMIAEIPAMFHELRTRTIVHPELDRLWFSDSVLDTEARKTVAANSKGWCEAEIHEWMKERFYVMRWPELYYTATQVMIGINENAGAKQRLKEVTRNLRFVMKVQEQTRSVRVPYTPERRMIEKKMGPDPVKQRWYVFRACDFLPPEDAAEIMMEARAEWAASPTDPVNIHENEPVPFPLLREHPEPTLENVPA